MIHIFLCQDILIHKYTIKTYISLLLFSIKTPAVLVKYYAYIFIKITITNTKYETKRAIAAKTDGKCT